VVRWGRREAPTFEVVTLEARENKRSRGFEEIRVSVGPTWYTWRSTETEVALLGTSVGTEALSYMKTGSSFL
jgi:hypothetical protein